MGIHEENPVATSAPRNEATGANIRDLRASPGCQVLRRDDKWEEPEDMHRERRERNSVPCKETVATWLEEACEWGPGVRLDS